MNNELPDGDTKTVKFLLKENLARYKLNNKGKKFKTLIIDDNHDRYNPTKNLSNKLKSKLAKKRRTNEYRAYQIKELAATDTVRKFAVRKRATITEEQSAFKAYANAYTISNIHLKGLNGLTYFPYQFDRLHDFFFWARCCLGQVPGGAPFSQRSEQATACTNRMQIRN